MLNCILHGKLQVGHSTLSSQSGVMPGQALIITSSSKPPDRCPSHTGPPRVYRSKRPPPLRHLASAGHPLHSSRLSAIHHSHQNRQGEGPRGWALLPCARGKPCGDEGTALAGLRAWVRPCWPAAGASCPSCRYPPWRPREPRPERAPGPCSQASPCTRICIPDLSITINMNIYIYIILAPHVLGARA